MSRPRISCRPKRTFHPVKLHESRVCSEEKMRAPRGAVNAAAVRKTMIREDLFRARALLRSPILENCAPCERDHHAKAQAIHKV